ncbi:ABC transporter substrate-binding protein [Chloroflexota bacterium]
MMMKKVIWIFVSCLMALSLLVASCGPAAVEEEKEKDTPVEQEKEEEEEEDTGQKDIVPKSNEPQYGGNLRIGLASDVIYFDEAFTMTITLGGFTHNEPAEGDWTKGPTGSGECDWTYSGNDRIFYKSGAVIESWDMPEAGHIIFKVRQGVHYSLDPTNEASALVGGREMTAEDIAYSLSRLQTAPMAYVHNAYPRLAETTVITAPDKWTVDIIGPADEFANSHSQWFDRNHVIAPELVEKYGDVNDWERQVGTGPFLLKDYLPSSSATFEKNSNYWRKDELDPGKGNQLPYLDSVKAIIILDTSTMQAALRTGKIDQTYVNTLEDAQNITRHAPELLSLRWLTHATQTIAMHLYDPELPTYDVRVRQAMMMATDLDTIAEQLYVNDAQTLCWPWPELKEYASMYLPFDEMPANVQEIYTYNPDKAKALLAEAGYPNGFKTRLDCRNTSLDVDFASVVKDQWSKVGIELDIHPQELGVHSSLWRGNTYSDMIIAGGVGIGSYYRFIGMDQPGMWNPSRVNDAHVQEVKKECFALFNEGDWDGVDATFKDLTSYMREQVWYIPRPLPYSYTLWWPWVKKYNGEISVGWAGPAQRWCQYVWVDQDLKKEMGY